MRVIVMYRSMSDYGTRVEDWLTDLERWHGVEVEELSPDSAEGSNFASVYDITSYPAVIVVRDGDGGVIQLWQGSQLPLIDDVAFWVNS